MRILHIITGLETGGAETMLAATAKCLQLRGHDQLVISLMAKGAVADRMAGVGLRLVFSGADRGRWPTVAQVIDLARHTRRFRPDVIQGWMYHGDLAATLAWVICGLKPKMIWSVHQTLYDFRNETPLTKQVIRLLAILSFAPHRIVFVSSLSLQHHERIGYRQDNAVAVPNGFDTGEFKPSRDQRSTFRKAIGIGDTGMLVGNVARYHPMKDHANLVRAAALIDADLPIRYVLVGDRLDDSNRPLTDLMVHHGVRDRFILLGERPDIPQILPALDLFVLSSAWGEAFPMTIGEAMACGVPCVATDIGDVGDLIGDTGRVVPPRDPEALAGAVQAFLTLTPDERATAGQMARRRVVDVFSIEAIVSRYEALYAGVSNGHCQEAPVDYPGAGPGGGKG
jgi:glycosyltransferase involved in cell wall biosynthesis